MVFLKLFSMFICTAPAFHVVHGEDIPLENIQLNGRHLTVCEKPDDPPTHYYVVQSIREEGDQETISRITDDFIADTSIGQRFTIFYATNPHEPARAHFILLAKTAPYQAMYLRRQVD